MFTIIPVNYALFRPKSQWRILKVFRLFTDLGDNVSITWFATLILKNIVTKIFLKLIFFSYISRAFSAP